MSLPIISLFVMSSIAQQSYDFMGLAATKSITKNPLVKEIVC
ncbi:hypothetical protein [Virgibacillus chiguensis]|nr:hypothetical protein [Virgibacillus chiguensis]